MVQLYRILSQASILIMCIGGLLGCSHVSSSARATKAPPPRVLTAWVTDDAHVLSPEMQQKLTKKLQKIEKKTTAEVVILTIPTLNGRDLKETATQIANATGIGKKGVNNGILILVVVQDRQVRLATGLGMESIITDEKAARLLDQYVIPNFKQGKYGDGLEAVVNAISKILQSSPSTSLGQPS